jgi:hypothetical protein
MKYILRTPLSGFTYPVGVRGHPVQKHCSSIRYTTSVVTHFVQRLYNTYFLQKLIFVTKKQLLSKYNKQTGTFLSKYLVLLCKVPEFYYELPPKIMTFFCVLTPSRLTDRRQRYGKHIVSIVRAGVSERLT